jgi:hypothetical protein
LNQAEFPELRTLEELRMYAKTFQDQVIQLQASIDGVDIPEPDLRKYSIQSQVFNFTLPQDNILGLASNTTTRAIANGNWVFLKPLSPREPKVTFKGDTVSPNANANSTGSNITATNTTANNNNNSFFSYRMEF